MAKVTDLAALFRAVSAQDWHGARVAATKIADAEARTGRHAAASTLRGSLSPNGSRVNGAVATIPSDGAIAPLASGARLGDVVLPNDVRRVLLSVIQEWRCRDRLIEAGVAPRARLLLHGPPGCGKSMTARAMAGELQLPAFVVRFDALVGPYLGQTAARLRHVFQFAEQVPCVLLFDEVDAIAKKRGSLLDVGELDRVVISLLQELEHAKPAGLIIAASNIALQLDEAVWRRFDVTAELPRPTKPALLAFARNRAESRGVSLGKGLRAEIAKARSYADIERLVDDALRRHVIAQSRRS